MNDQRLLTWHRRAAVTAARQVLALTAAVIVALGVVAGAATAIPARAVCNPGSKTIGGQKVVVFCGPAHATVRYAGHTIVYRNGNCASELGMFTVNIGITMPGALKQRFPYFGLTVDGTHAGKYTRQNLVFAYRGIVYAIGQHTIVLHTGLTSGTFTGKTFPGLRAVSGTFHC